MSIDSVAMMQRATTVILPPDKRLAEARQTVTLSREDRYRRRTVLTTDCGASILLDLAQATYMPDGSGLETESGVIVLIRAAMEPLLEIKAGDAVALSRIAWHIGNRHTPAEISDGAIFIQADHVLADMVRGLGGQVTRVTRTFEPEGGAYGGHVSLQHGHHHHAHHDHAHEHGKDLQGYAGDRNYDSGKSDV